MAKREARRRCHRGLDRGDADLAVALRGGTITRGEECAFDRDGQVQGRSRGELLDVHVPATFSRRDRAVLARFGERDAHHPEEWLEAYAHTRSELRRDAVELPHLEIRLGKVLGKQAAAGIEGEIGRASCRERVWSSVVDDEARGNCLAE